MGVEDTEGFGGDALMRPMKPIPGSEILVPVGIGKEDKNDPASPIRVEMVIRRNDKVPSAGSNVRTS